MLRQQVKTARSLGISWRRFTGWEPVEYRVETPGGVRVIREPEYDWLEQAVQTGYTVWEAGLHVCGLALEDTVIREGVQPSDFQVESRICAACAALEYAARLQYDYDEPARRSGGMDWAQSRVWTVKRRGCKEV